MHSWKMKNWFKSENFCLRLPMLHQSSDVKPFELPWREGDETIYTSVKICLECSILHAFLSNKRKFYNSITILIFELLCFNTHCIEHKEQGRTVCIGDCGTTSINLKFYFKKILENINKINELQ